MAVRKGGFADFRQSYIPLTLLTTEAVDVSATTTTGLINVNGTPLRCYHAGAGGGAQWVNVATSTTLLGGVTPPIPTTDNIGFELGGAGAVIADPSCPSCFTVGTDAAFFVRATIGHSTVITADADAASAYVAVGFRTAAANAVIANLDTVAKQWAGTSAPYSENTGVALSLSTVGKFYTFFQTNGGAGTNTDTTQIGANGISYTIQVNVATTGVVTCLLSTNASTTPIPVATTAGSSPGTLTAAKVVTPFLTYVSGTATPAIPYINSFSWGLL